MRPLVVLLVLGSAAALVVAAIVWAVGWVGLMAVGVIGFASLALLYFSRARLAKAVARSFLLMKSRGLRDADVSVHSVRAVPCPDASETTAALTRDDFDTDDAFEEYVRETEAELKRGEEAAWYESDLTIVPKERGGEPAHWDVDCFAVAPPDAPSLLDLDPVDSGDQVAGADAECLKIWSDELSEFVTDEVGKHTGRQRLLLRFPAAPGHREIQLRYFFEQLCVISLPEVIGGDHAAVARDGD